MSIKTNFIITCDQAFLSANSNNLNLIGIFSQINGTNFPLTYPRFALVANFDVDQHGDYTLEARITGPDGSQLAQARMPVQVTSSPFQIITNFENLTFPAPGRYELKLSLDSADIGSRFIQLMPVIKQAPGQA